MKVYIVLDKYIRGRIVVVLSSEEKAKEYIKKNKLPNRDDLYYQEHEVLEG